MLGEATHQELRLRRSDQSSQAVQAIRESALNAHTVTPHDLRRAFWPTRLLPRVELNNSTYPPAHGPAWFWTSGRRHPAVHAEEHPILLHDTVRDRGLHYSPEALRRRTRTRLNPEPMFHHVGNQSIVMLRRPRRLMTAVGPRTRGVFPHQLLAPAPVPVASGALPPQ